MYLHAIIKHSENTTLMAKTLIVSKDRGRDITTCTMNDTYNQTLARL